MAGAAVSTPGRMANHCSGRRTMRAPASCHCGRVRAQLVTYGPLRMHLELTAQGFPAGRDRIVRLRREFALRCKKKRKLKATTNSNHDLPVADSLLNQTCEEHCSAPAPL